MKTKILKFGNGNTKLDSAIKTFSLPAGYSCPMANECLAFANRKTGQITDGKNQEFRCFSASSEAIFPQVRKSRWENFDLLKGKTKDQMKEVILVSLPKFVSIMRIHVSGDFFSQDYFDAWLEVAKEKKSVIFYAYTKSLTFWVNRLGDIPENFKLTASKGGKNDALIVKHNLKFAEVVYSEQEAEEKNLEIDHDDSHAYDGKESFALLIHGIQKAGSEAGKAKKLLAGKGSYGKSQKLEVA